MNKKGEATAKLDAIGVEAICEMISDCKSMTEICAEIGVSIGRLIDWIAADPERSARAREVRSNTAGAWDEKAERGIAEATTPDELARAKELAHHYRWRASKIAPRVYGDKLELGGEVGVRDLTALIQEGRKRARGE